MSSFVTIDALSRFYTKLKTYINGCGFIKTVNNTAPDSAGNISVSAGMGPPNWRAGVTKKANTQYTAEVAGYVYIDFSSRDSPYTQTINGKKMVIGPLGSGSGLNYYFVNMFPVNKGDTYKMIGDTIIFYPAI